MCLLPSRLTAASGINSAFDLPKTFKMVDSAERSQFKPAAIIVLYCMTRLVTRHMSIETKYCFIHRSLTLHARHSALLPVLWTTSSCWRFVEKPPEVVFDGSLNVRSLRLVGDRPFATCGPWLWNEPPVTCAPVLPAFRRKVKTRLFRQSYPNIIF
jgi:hypothetical protein